MPNYALIKDGRVIYKIISEYSYAKRYVLDGRADTLVELKGDEIATIYTGYIYNYLTKEFIPNYEDLSLTEAKELKKTEISNACIKALSGPCKTTVVDPTDGEYVTVDMTDADCTMWQDGLWRAIYVLANTYQAEFFGGIDPVTIENEMLELSLKRVPIRLFKIARNGNYTMEIQDYYNKSRVLTIRQVHEIALQQGMSYSTVWIRKWRMRVAIDSCKSIDELMQIQW